jgi:uncharacterized protein YeaO (DUF488 family)
VTGKRSEPVVRVVRVYDPPGVDDGWRVLVDRLWPRGLRKENVHFNEWCKDVAPSTELRSWYRHRPDRFEEFARRYERELDDPEHSDALSRLSELAVRQQVTLLTATKKVAISGAQVLATVLNRRRSRCAGPGRHSADLGHQPPPPSVQP